MTATRPSIGFRFMPRLFVPGLADFAFLVPAAFLLTRPDGIRELLADGDTGWHIRAGEWIWAHRAVPAHDLFSYSKAGAPWFAWEWGSDVLMAGVNAAGGLRAVTFAALVLLCAIFLLLFRLARRKSNPIVAAAVTLLAVAGASIHYLARPHLFTLLFTLLFAAALEEMREGRERLWGVPYLAILPIATAVWANLHGGFVVGLVLMAAYGVSDVVRALAGPDEERARTARQSVRYFACAGLCLAASLANPYFYHLHEHIVSYLQTPFNLKYIHEFQSPSFHSEPGRYFEILLGLAAAAATWNLARGRLTEPIVLLLMAHAGLLARRNVPLFAMVAAPLVAAAVQEWLDRLPSLDVPGWLKRAAVRYGQVAANAAAAENAGRWPVWSAAGLALIAALVYAPHPPGPFRAEFDPKEFPSGALAVLREDPAARIFTFDQWGDYLIWSLYPEQKVFVDGRSDFYGNDFEEKLMGVFNARYDWEKTLDGFRINTILLQADAPLAGVLKESSRWRVIYDDHVALVFRPASAGPRQTLSAASLGGGISRDREITKTVERDPAITADQSESKKHI